MIGTNIGHYKVVQKLGEGGMGEVFLAEDTKLNRQVALKFLPSQYASEENFKARFKREAQAAAALNHPNIITIHEVSEYEGRPFIAMEYVEGESLKDLVAGEDLSLDRVIDLGIQISGGLAKAHQQGIVHRDVKPQNVVIDKDGRARILDFGLAKLARDAMLTRTGSTVGTVAYMSPEQATGEEADARSDVFSFGVVLYEMITRRLPFQGDHEAAVMHSIVSDTPEPLARYKAEVPEELQRIVDKALRKDIGTRYQSAADLMADLKELRKEGATQATLSTKSVYRPAREGRSRSILVAGIVLVALIVLVSYLVFKGAPVPAPPGAEMTSRSVWRSSVAVLPFRDFSPDRDQEYFCDGMTDAIIGKLSGLQDLKVISMSSVMRYKSPELDIREIGRELGVATVLEGSIQKEGERIRLSAQLVNVADGSHLWSETYDRQLESVFSIQDEVSQAIVNVLKIRLLGNDRAAFVKRHTENLEAYNAYTQGRFLWNKRTEEDLMKSIEYFERAIELDPGYALAYAGLADAYAVLPSNIGYPAEEVVSKAKEAALKALDLDEDLAEAHASLGLALKIGNEAEEAEKRYHQAIALNPGYAYAHYWYSLLLHEMGKPDESMIELETAFQLNPLSVVILTNLASRVGAAGDWQKAEELIKRAIEIEPNRATTYAVYAGGLRAIGRRDEAIEVYAQAVQADSSYLSAYNELAYLNSYAGDFDKAVGFANRYVELAPEEANPYDTRGDIYAHYGKLDQAIENYEKVLEIDPNFDNTLWKLTAMHVFKREYAKAESLIRRFLLSKDEGTRSSVSNGLAHILVYQGKFEQALSVLDEGIAADKKEQTEAWTTIGKHSLKLFIHLEKQNLDLAFREIELMREIQERVYPDDPVKLQNAYAIVWALRGQTATADEILRTWRENIDESNPGLMSGYHRVSGIVEFFKGNAEEAITHLRRGLTENSKPLFEARYFLGEAYLQTGQPEEAASLLERALLSHDERRMVYPTLSVRAHYLLGKAYQQLGRNEGAIEQYKEFLDIWKDADLGIPEVEDAEQRLKDLRLKS